MNLLKEHFKRIHLKNTLKLFLNDILNDIF